MQSVDRLKVNSPKENIEIILQFLKLVGCLEFGLVSSARRD